MPRLPTQYHPPGWQPKKHDDDYNKWRGTAASRGYDTTWNKARDIILKAEPLCRSCKAIGIIKPAELVHHDVEVSVDPSRRLDPTNLIPVCKSCHALEHALRRNRQ